MGFDWKASFPQAEINNMMRDRAINRFVMYLCYLFKINRFKLKNLFGHQQFREDLTLQGGDQFTQQALALFCSQAAHNPLYRSYLDILSIEPASIQELNRIPFLPIRFFKSHDIQTGEFIPAYCFESSGTTGAVNSRHCIKSMAEYLENAEANFIEFYGDPSDYCILALLPSYLERNHSSLVSMADHLINKSGHPESGFFLHDLARLHDVIQGLEAEGKRTLLLGVTYALLDFAEGYPMKLRNTMVMETGGMKGRREEITRSQLHDFLKDRLGIEMVHAEYGMTELLSQAYSFGEGIFEPSSTMQILMRSADDPFEVWTADEYPMRSGVINVIDLANKHSIAFIATDDLGRFTGDGGFEVTGRLDHCDVRGCSLLSI